MKKNKIVSNFLLVLAISIFSFSAGFAAESSSPEAVEHYNAGLEYVMQEDYERASLAFQKALEYDPELVDAYFNLGSLYEHFGDYQTAIRAYTEVVALEPRDFETMYKIGELYVKLGYRGEALNCLYAIPQGTSSYTKAQTLLAQLGQQEQQQQQQPATAEQKVDEQKVNNTQTAETQTTEVKDVRSMEPSTNTSLAERTMEGRTPNGGYTDPDKTLLSKYSSPTGITIDRLGNIFVASYADNSIYVVTPDEKNSVFSNSPMLDGPIGIVADQNGTLYVANYNKDNILRITRDGNVSIYKSDVMKPYALSIMNNTLYVSEQGTNSVIKFRLR